MKKKVAKAVKELGIVFYNLDKPKYREKLAESLNPHGWYKPKFNKENLDGCSYVRIEIKDVMHSKKYWKNRYNPYALVLTRKAWEMYEKKVNMHGNLGFFCGIDEETELFKEFGIGMVPENKNKHDLMVSAIHEQRHQLYADQRGFLQESFDERILGEFFAADVDMRKDKWSRFKTMLQIAYHQGNEKTIKKLEEVKDLLEKLDENCSPEEIDELFMEHHSIWVFRYAAEELIKTKK
jgi:hypothetical protein